MDPSPALRQSPPRDRWLDKFERQADLTPSRTAVISSSGSMTYGELTTRSNRLARRLRSRGVGRGNFVGLGLAASLELPVALLGIMKSGAAYVPLDPGYRAAHIGRTVDAAGIRHVVTRRDLAAPFTDLEAIFLDELAPATTSPALAYASRSRGDSHFSADFGGCHHHRESLPRWYSIELETGLADRTLIISSPSFDLTRTNFFVPLLTGGTLVLDDDASHGVSRIFSLLRDLEVTLIHCTPAAFYPLVDAAVADAYAALASLRFAVLSGEPISVRRLRPWLEHPTCHAEVVNSHGSSNAGVVHRLHRGNLDDDLSARFGRQIRKSVVRSMEMAMPPPDRGNATTPELSPLESRVLALWSEVLDRPLSDPGANFLDLGGNSIHLAVIHVRLMEMTSRRLSLASLLALPTARAIAEFLVSGKLPDPSPVECEPVRKAHAGFTKVRRPVTR